MRTMIRIFLFIAVCSISAYGFQSDNKAGTKTPAQVAQALVDAYNAHDLEGILRTYHPNSVAKRLPGGEPFLNGHADIRKKFEGAFQRSEKLKVEVTQRIVDGDFVIDKEKITGVTNGKPFERYGVVIYEIREGLIVNEWYPQSRPVSK